MDFPENICIKMEDIEAFQNDEVPKSDLFVLHEGLNGECEYGVKSNSVVDGREGGRSKNSLTTSNRENRRSKREERYFVSPPCTKLNDGLYCCSKCIFKSTSQERVHQHFRNLHKDLTTFFNNITNNTYQATPNHKNVDMLFTLAEDVKPAIFTTTDTADKVLETTNNLPIIIMDHALSYRAESSTYECGSCSFITTTVAKAAEHLKKVHNHKDLHCFCCKYSTNKKEQLDKHIECHLRDTDLKKMIQSKVGTKVFNSTGDESFQCFNCYFVANNMNDLKKHYLLLHIKKLLICIICKQEFRYLSVLETHVKEVHILNRAYNCLYCEFTTKKRIDFRKHMKCHDINEENTNVLQNYTSIVTNDNSINVLDSTHLYKCLHCDFYTKHKGNLITHFTLHKHQTQPNISEITSNVENSYKCSYCSFSSVLKKNVKEHVINMHSDKQPYYLCKMCGKHFISAVGRKNHMRKVHVERRTLFCMHCKFSTNYLRSLELHMQYHTGELSQLCYVCGIRSVHQGQMDVHIRKHFGLELFSCNICTYKTPDKSKLCEHMYKHTTVRPFSCDECDHRSKSKRDLKLHKESHIVNKPIACDLCNYTCTRNEYLNRHMKVHQVNRERTFFECDKCPKQFTSMASLKQHKLFHDGIKLHCRFCSFFTNRIISLQLHEGRHSELSRMHCYQCSYNSTHRPNFIEHVNKTCAKARHKDQNLRYCYYCGYSSNHRSNFVNHVNKGCNKLKKKGKKGR